MQDFYTVFMFKLTDLLNNRWFVIHTKSMSVSTNRNILMNIEQTNFNFDTETNDKNIKNNVLTRQKKQKSLIDKFYTNKECVKHIVDVILEFFPEIDFFIEPSAGCGNISHYLKDTGKKVVAYDLVPESSEIIQADYLKTTITKEKHLTIGNPPFGYKGDLAVAFLNKALQESYAVGFIMPITAKKYSLQNKVLATASLIYQEVLPNDSFELPDKTKYSCPAVFQIWSLNKFENNIRKNKPKTKHEDFILYRHNATPQSSKYVDMDWDFAVYAQGRKDYTKIFLQSEKQLLKDKIKNSSDQFYFFKALNNEILERLLHINFKDLAYRDHITPGFCKNDIVEEYEKLIKQEAE